MHGKTVGPFEMSLGLTLVWVVVFHAILNEFAFDTVYCTSLS